MKIEKLTKDRLISLYPQLERTFPEDELKPLSRMLAAFDRDAYDCFGLTEHHDILGYAFFVRTGNDILFDYFGILEEHRNHGLGTIFLGMLESYFKSAKSVLVEVEDPDETDHTDSDDIRSRRAAFYLRNGFISTDVRVFSFGVKYLLLEYRLSIPHEKEDVRSLYSEHYRTMLPVAMYERNIRF